MFVAVKSLRVGLALLAWSMAHRRLARSSTALAVLPPSDDVVFNGYAIFRTRISRRTQARRSTVDADLSLYALEFRSRSGRPGLRRAVAVDRGRHRRTFSRRGR